MLSGSLAEEIGRGHAERGRDLLYAAAADTIDAFLVFLHLLERDAQLRAEPFLTFAAGDAKHAQPGADLSVEFGCFLGPGHRRSPIADVGEGRPRSIESAALGAVILSASTLGSFARVPFPCPLRCASIFPYPSGMARQRVVALQRTVLGNRLGRDVVA
jgi:hypothetical protein